MELSSRKNRSKNLDNNIKQKIKRYLQEKNKSPKQIAILLGISISTVYKVSNELKKSTDSKNEIEEIPTIPSNRSENERKIYGEHLNYCLDEIFSLTKKTLSPIDTSFSFKEKKTILSLIKLLKPKVRYKKNSRNIYMIYILVKVLLTEYKNNPKKHEKENNLLLELKKIIKSFKSPPVVSNKVKFLITNFPNSKHSIEENTMEIIQELFQLSESTIRQVIINFQFKKNNMLDRNEIYNITELHINSRNDYFS